MPGLYGRAVLTWCSHGAIVLRRCPFVQQQVPKLEDPARQAVRRDITEPLFDGFKQRPLASFIEPHGPRGSDCSESSDEGCRVGMVIRRSTSCSRDSHGISTVSREVATGTTSIRPFGPMPASL
jgi:hypothetical protein